MHRLSESEKYSFAAGLTRNLVIIVEKDFRIEWVNNSFCELTGYTMESCIGKRLSDFMFGPDKDKAVITEIYECLTRGVSIAQEVIQYTKDGKPVWVSLEMSPLLDADGSINGYIAIETDITAKKEQEEELERSRKELEEMFEYTVMPMCYNDPKGKFVKANSAFCELFECREEEIIGKHYMEVYFRHLPVDDQKALKQEATEFLSSDKVFRKEMKVVSSKKTSLLVEVVMKNVIIGAKHMVSVYVIDKTEKRDFEERILDQNKRLKEFAYITSHKLRQPLANILGLVELVKSESQPRQDVTITFETLRMLTGQLDGVVHEMNEALAELDIEAEKSLFLNEFEDNRIHNVWIVDDDQVITYITHRLLSNADPSLHVTEFLSAKMALEKLRIDGNYPDILLLDINMPGISGWEFLDELKQLRRFVNVYMYSSSIDPEDVKRARAYPMVREFLSKPLDMKMIRHLLDVPLVHRKVG